MTPVSILVANYKSGDAIALCIESVRRFTPEGSYRLIVLNDYDPDDLDGPYLRAARERGWIELYQARERLYHGGALNVLWNEIVQTPVAVNLDNDIEIRGPGWLETLTALLAPDVLAVCDSRPHHAISEQGYCPAFYRFWFAAVNVNAYGDGMQVDWRFAYAKRNEPPYDRMLADVAKLNVIQKHAPGFDDNRVCLDPGSKLWVKVHAENPRGYKVLSIPPSMSGKFRHYGHVSYFADVPDDHDDYTRREKPARRAEIRTALARLRAT